MYLFVCLCAVCLQSSRVCHPARVSSSGGEDRQHLHHQRFANNVIIYVHSMTRLSLFFSAATQWIDKWKKNGWRTAARGDVKNQADLQRLDDLCKRVDVKWVSESE